MIHVWYQGVAELMISYVNDIIPNIIRNLYWYHIWYHVWYHTSASMISRTYDIIALWYHSQYLWYPCMISLMISYMISWSCIYDIKNLWYHGSMISYHIEYHGYYVWYHVWYNPSSGTLPPPISKVASILKSSILKVASILNTQPLISKYLLWYWSWPKTFKNYSKVLQSRPAAARAGAKALRPLISLSVAAGQLSRRQGCQASRRAQEPRTWRWAGGQVQGPLASGQVQRSWE